MLLLSVDSSAVTVSVAITDGEKVIKSELFNKGLTHSETLLPLIERVMGEIEYKSLDAIAVSVGPGSFTGVRIGVSVVKGIAFANDIDCIGVSTLEAIGYNFIDENTVVCAVMDARRMQFYNAIFKTENGQLVRLCDDRAVSAQELKDELKQYETVVIAGDGAELLYNSIHLENTVLAPEEKRFQNGVGVARAAENKKAFKSDLLMPVYLRPSQAERELKLKKENIK